LSTKLPPNTTAARDPSVTVRPVRDASNAQYLLPANVMIVPSVCTTMYEMNGSIFSRSNACTRPSSIASETSEAILLRSSVRR